MKPKIESIKIVHYLDETADVSWIGEYTDTWDEWAICRHCGEYLHIAEAPNRRMEEIEEEIYELEEENGEDSQGKIDGLNSELATLKLHECPTSRREYNYFKPYAGSAEPGTEDYQKYGKQDFERMESLERGDWQFIGIRAEAEVSTAIEDNPESERFETFTSSGLWGIESDSDDAYLLEVADEELADLKKHLENYGVDTSNFDELAEGAKGEEPEFRYH